MRGRGRGGKRNRGQQRHGDGHGDSNKDARPNDWKRSRHDSGGEPGWNPFVRESPAFEAFYKKQKIVPEEEWDAFITTFRKPLATTFRINGSGQFALEIRDQMQRDFFDQLKNETEVDGEVIEPVRALPWYPDNLAWHLNYSRMQIRKMPILERIHEFLKLENEVGSITRQEAVSMIPPLFMDVQPHHKVLDMCAAPGSKTFQLLEMIHRGLKPGELSDGMVVANDSDAKRCHLLIHQTKRMCSPNIVVTNHDAQLFPGLKDKSGHPKTTSTENCVVDTEISEEETNGLYFDRILCDVPCSGDGTLRKAPDIWRKWNCGVANGLHRLQIQIAMRGVALLRTGGRLVYSTCSLNPVENEAVVGEILRESRGSVELLDVSSELPELKRRPGLTSWLIRDRKKWLCSASKIERHRAGAVVPSMFPSGSGWDLSDLEPPTEVSSLPTDAGDDVEKNEAEEGEEEEEEGPPEVVTLPLERCMRLLPHDQDSGGFFIAVFRKIAPFKAISKVLEPHKSLISHKRSDKETVIADGEKDLLPIKNDSTLLNTDAADNVLPEVDLLDIQPEEKTEADNEVGAEHVSDIEENKGLALEEASTREAGEELRENIVAEEVEATISDTKDPNALGRAQRQGRWKGVDPVLFLEDENIIRSLVDFYGIKETFPVHQHFVVRSEDLTRCKRIYYVSASVGNTIQQNYRAGEQMKIVSAGMKIFERLQSKEADTTCDFRISSEGLPLLLPHMTKQIVRASMKDFRLLLANKVISFSTFKGSDFAVALKELNHGCCVVALTTEGPDASTNPGAMSTAVACWKGRSNISVLITKAEANQMYQRLSFGDKVAEPTLAEAKPITPDEVAVGMEVESKRTQIDDLQSTDAGSKIDQVVTHNIDEELQNGTVPGNAD
ncbi:hypothetical protein KC19_10G061000 [Ceratodon purpureus]|uniref:SAM-dependent MTase RsmB/NOP-type domain-containing protein n=1 Tax=Ceratodon purpureus TaxID=3225 RepID=A0A8T0GJX2_CERPU|nr:hypothetical protein KC19_10G061000 [Ceratodon purpureus]